MENYSNQNICKEESPNIQQSEKLLDELFNKLELIGKVSKPLFFYEVLESMTFSEIEFLLDQINDFINKLDKPIFNNGIRYYLKFLKIFYIPRVIPHIYRKNSHFYKEKVLIFFLI